MIVFIRKYSFKIYVYILDDFNSYIFIWYQIYIIRRLRLRIDNKPY